MWHWQQPQIRDTSIDEGVMRHTLSLDVKYAWVIL